MMISLKEKFGSLLPFDQQLPKFTLVTGLNGSGKSQLLNGLANKVIECDILQTGQPIRFTALDFKVPASLDAHLDFNNLSRRTKFVARAAHENSKLRDEWLKWGSDHQLDYEELRQKTMLAFPITRGPVNIDVLSADLLELKSLIEDMRSRAHPLEFSDTHPSQIYGRFNEVEHASKLPYFILNEREILDALSITRPLFNISLSSVFTQYRDNFLLNRIAQIDAQDGHVGARPRTSEQFLEEFGPPPWELINSILDTFGVDAYFLPPPANETTLYTPIMRNSSNDAFAHEQLSSGEVIILNLALLGYMARDKRQKFNSPYLVLLDEVDAPLHPAMAKSYLSVINDVLVQQFDIHVIATTHSPSTVAQSDAESIFVMAKGTPGLAPLSKDQAISVLTEGVPTLSVHIADRRQVFAESPVEAENFEALYRILKPTLSSPLSLQFIATGSKQTNSSKVDVERIVGDLSKAGNKTAFGIIDWDTKNIPSDRIKVLAIGRRYALENVILDPVVLALEIYRSQKTEALKYFGLDPELHVYSLETADADIWQRLADAVTGRVLDEFVTDRIVCSYHGGLEIQLDRRYLHHPAHPLEKAITTAYPFLESFTRSGSGKLTKHLIDTVLTRLPKFIPIEVEQIFKELQQ